MFFGIDRRKVRSKPRNPVRWNHVGRIRFGPGSTIQTFLLLVVNIVTTSKVLVTSSDALVPSRFFFWSF